MIIKIEIIKRSIRKFMSTNIIELSKKEHQKMLLKFAFVFACAAIYTYLRYIIYGNVNPEQIPVFLFNKTMSMVSVAFCFIAAIHYGLLKSHISKVKAWGTASLHSAYIHILLSLSIFGNSYYGKFFNNEKLTLSGELIIFSGLVAIYCFWLINKTNYVKIHTLQILASVFITIHLVVMGLSGWLTVSKWHGGLPPISLVSVAMSVIALVLFFRKRENLNSKKTKEESISIA
jgi:hypothetical protein